MRVILTKPSLVMHGAGEIVEVSPDRANYLLSVGAAVVEKREEEPKEAKPKTTRKKK